MINHVKTLLLNMSLSELTSDGSEAPWFVDPHFNDMQVPDGLKPIYDSLFPDGYDLEEKKNSVRAAMVIVHCPELSCFLSMFDPRETGDRQVSTVKDLYDFMPDGVQGLENRLIASFTGAKTLFRPSGDKSIDDNLERMKKVAFESNEATLRAGAILLAYSVQMDLERAGR